MMAPIFFGFRQTVERHGSKSIRATSLQSHLSLRDKEKKGEDKMVEETIPELADESWQKENELGKVTEVIEYQTGTGIARVSVTGNILSGAQVEALEAKYMTTDNQGNVTMDTTKYMRELQKLVLGMSGDKFQSIMDNKPADLRMKLRDFVTRIVGLSGEEEIKEEKNSEGPAPSTNTSEPSSS